MEKLTNRQTDVARLLVAGNAYDAIAKDLQITSDTVKSHAEAIYRKLGVTGREELTRRFSIQFAGTAVNSLAGYWLSRYEFESHSIAHDGTTYKKGSQVNLEVVVEAEKEGFFTHDGHSICSAPSGIKAFEHVFHFKIIDQVAVGIWENLNTRNVGCMHLVIRSDHRGMHGAHLGNTSDFVVKSGSWIWRKVNVVSNHSFEVNQSNFKRIDELENLFSTEIDQREPIQLRELFV